MSYNKNWLYFRGSQKVKLSWLFICKNVYFCEIQIEIEYLGYLGAVAANIREIHDSHAVIPS